MFVRFVLVVSLCVAVPLSAAFVEKGSIPNPDTKSAVRTKSPVDTDVRNLSYVGTFASSTFLLFGDNPITIEKVDTQGNHSAAFDDAPARAKCPHGFSLTGCSCLPRDLETPSCDGSAPTGMGTCTAYNSVVGIGVNPVATCVNFGEDATVETKEGLPSTADPNAKSRAECPSGTLLTGCSCHSLWMSCTGAYISSSNPNECVAVNSNEGLGVVAHAICVGNIDSVVEQSFEVHTVSGAASHTLALADCTSINGPTILASCSCHSEDRSCIGSRADGPVCFAYGKSDGAGFVAMAHCLSVAQPAGIAPEAASPPTETPPVKGTAHHKKKHHGHTNYTFVFTLGGITVGGVGALTFVLLMVCR